MGFSSIFIYNYVSGNSSCLMGTGLKDYVEASATLLKLIVLDTLVFISPVTTTTEVETLVLLFPAVAATVLAMSSFRDLVSISITTQTRLTIFS